MLGAFVRAIKVLIWRIRQCSIFLLKDARSVGKRFDDLSDELRLGNYHLNHPFPFHL